MSLNKKDYKIVEEWLFEFFKEKNYFNKLSEKEKQKNTEIFIKLLENKFLIKETNTLNEDLMTTVFPDFVKGRNYNLLNISISQNNNILFDWCLKNKFNPAFFIADGTNRNVSAIGLSAYTGNVYALEKLIEVGVDPLLKASSSDSDMNGATLLHRIMERNIHSKLEVIKILADAYSDLKLTTTSGLKIWDFSSDDIGVDYIKQKIANQEKEDLMKILNINDNNITLPIKRI